MRQKAVTDNLDQGYLANVTRVRTAAFYCNALALAERCPALIAELGEPLEADLPKGRIDSLIAGTPVERAVTQRYLATMLEMMQIENPMGETEEFAHVSVVLRGPNGHGKLIMFASGLGDSWTIHSLSMTFDGREDWIPIIRADA